MQKTSHHSAIPDQRIASTKRPGITLEIFEGESAKAALREKEYLKYQDMTPAQRIEQGEQLRTMAYGEKYTASRLQGPVEVLKRS